MKSPQFLFAIALLLIAGGGCNLGEPITTSGGGGTEVEGLSGTLVTVGGLPAAGAIVRAYSADEDDASLARRAVAGNHVAPDTAVAADTADSSGSFVLAGLPEGVYNIAATLSRGDSTYALFRQRVVVSGPAALPADTLRPGGTFSLRVVTGETSLAGALCAVPASPWTAVSDSTGLCLLTGLPPGVLHIEVTYPGAAVHGGDHTVTPGDTSEPDTVDLPDVPATLGVPTLVRPSSGTQHALPVTNLGWTHVAGAAWYHIQIATDSSFESIIYANDTTVTDSFLTLTLNPGYAYHTRVRARNALATGDWSAPHYFVIPLTEAAFIPALLSPLPGATLTALDSAGFGWSGVAGAASYELQISPDSGFGSIVPVPLSDTTYFTDSLAPGVYIWRVRALVDDTLRAWSSHRSFFVPDSGTGTTDAPMPVTPADGATGVGLTPGLSWTAIGTATHDAVEISTDSAFTTARRFVDTAVTDTMRTAEWGIDSGTVYFWRVRAEYGSIASGAWSEVRTFTTAGNPPPPPAPAPPPPSPPPAPSLILPAHMATGVSTTPTLTWTPDTSGTTAHYRVLVATDSSFTAPVFNDSTHTESATVGPLASGTSYFWRVQAVNATATTNSMLRHFTTEP